ncbi:MAG: hypothetical protein K2R93_08950 [Gemmatimonadaceae bacterium]|nr:hypothetical protein [Gemmatimonadaceae bacterium]
MNVLDWLVVGAYISAVLYIGWRASGSQTDHNEYYLGGRGFSYWQIGLSTMATQLSAVSFISAPAFVGLRRGGGMQWLSYEFAVPLAMLFLVTVIIPPLYQSKVISVYEFLERQFSGSTRLLVSVVFQLSRAFATGIKVYALALVLSVVLRVPVWSMIIFAGSVTTVYSVMGGMRAVVYTDIVQLSILFLGILACGGVGLHLIGGWDAFTVALDRSRLQAVNFGGLGINDGAEFGFWPMVLGGFFLYASYYGTDQSQAQRALSGRNLGEIRGALIFNGLMRFPLTFLYCAMGLILGTVAITTPAFRASIPEARPDLLVPTFIATYLPHGLVGLLIIAVLSAGMSAMSATINSLAAVSIEDFIVRRRTTPLADAAYIRTSRLITAGWGIACMAFAFAAGNIASTVIEAINKVGSLFYGSILATFVLAMLTTRVSPTRMNLGIVAGVLTNVILWVFFPTKVFWFWWNLTGFVVTTAVAVLGPASRVNGGAPPIQSVVVPRREALILVSYFVAMLSLALALPHLI